MNEINIFDKIFNVEEKYPLSGQKEVYRVSNNLQKFIIKIIEFKEISEIERSYREAEFLMKKNNSDYFPKIYNINLSLPEKKFYILEEFISGDTLENLKSTYKDNEKKVIILLLNLIEGLNFLWKNKIIHRDLKPLNIIIKNNEKPVILDLGIAKFLEMSSVTLGEKRMPYSNFYFAPEQYKNIQYLISHRTDFFVLGIVIYELFTGKRPFNNNEEILKCTYIKTGNKNFDNLLEKLLKIQPYERFKNYKVFKEHLENYLKNIN